MQNRIIDLTEQAARIIGSYKHGITKVKLEIIQPSQNTDSIEKFHDKSNCRCRWPNYNSFRLHYQYLATRDFDHALLLAKYLQQEEYIQSFMLAKKSNGRPLYHILVFEYCHTAKALKLKDFWERKALCV